MIESTLICITSCNRLGEIKKYILPYIDFVNRNEGFHFLLALDGNDKGYIDFCTEFGIPLLYSQEQEGVGISKNRVLKQFPDFEHYFFIDDDVELVDDKIFQLHIELAKKSEKPYHHLSSTRIVDLSATSKVDGYLMNHSYRGGGYFNYFTKFGLGQVGGWHTEFAHWKRYGHTEHSTRFVNAGLSEYAFNSIEDSIKMIIIHDPKHVTIPIGNHDENEFSEPEQKILSQKLKHFEIKTISSFTFNGYITHYIEKVDSFLKNNSKKYPFLKGKERRKAKSAYYFFLFQINRSFFKRVLFLSLSLIYNLKNMSTKHWLKSKLMRS